MPNEYPRSHRVADFIQREIVDLIRNEVNDPRMSEMLTVSSVEVSRDLGTAKIHYTILNAEDGEREDTEEALKKANGFLRRKLASRLNTRSVPQLRFYYDDSIERGAHMSSLIDSAVASNSTDDPNSPDAAASQPNESPSNESQKDEGLNGPA